MLIVCNPVKEATMPNETDNEEGGRGNVSRRNFFERIGVAGAVAAMPTGPVPAAAQTPAIATEVSADDRFRIQDVLRSYVWANDSASVERVVAAFTPDGIVQPATGERIPVRRWAGETFAQPGRRGRQHWVQHISFERTADGVTVRSYWKVAQGLASRNTRTLAAMGFYDDFCVKFDGHWLIKEKRIYRCDDEAPLPW
jgi:hypothetical protein